MLLENPVMLTRKKMMYGQPVCVPADIETCVLFRLYGIITVCSIFFLIKIKEGIIVAFKNVRIFATILRYTDL